MCFYYDETPEFAKSSYVKTRKAHRCEACLSTIAAGELVKHSSGLFDGSFYSHYVCNRCAQLELLIVQHELEEGCNWHEAWPPWEEMREYADEAGIGKPESSADLRQLYANLGEFHKSLCKKARL